MSTGSIGGAGGDASNNYLPLNKKETDGTEGSETVVPKVTEPAQANPPRESDGSVASTNDASNSGLGDRQRGGDQGLHKKPKPTKVKTINDEESTEPPRIVDELDLSPEALALTDPRVDPGGAADNREAREHPPEKKIQDDPDKLDLEA